MANPLQPEFLGVFKRLISGRQFTRMIRSANAITAQDTFERDARQTGDTLIAVARVEWKKL